jgi:MarR family transcriptional regulator for hemolysin
MRPYNRPVPEPLRRSTRMDESQNIELTIPRISRLMRRVYGEYFAQMDLSMTQALLIGLLDTDEIGPQNQTVLAERVGLRKAFIGNTLDVLVAGGQVARSADPTDARAKLITLTDSGREIAAEVDQRFGELAAAVRRRTTKAQREAVIEVLEIIAENMERFAVDHDLPSAAGRDPE